LTIVSFFPLHGPGRAKSASVGSVPMEVPTLETLLDETRLPLTVELVTKNWKWASSDVNLRKKLALDV